MEWIARRDDLSSFETEDRLAAVWCEDERHAEVDHNHPIAVMVLDDPRDDASGVADHFWYKTEGQCLDISVKVTSVGRFLSDPGSGERTRFSIPLRDRLYECESCGKEYITLKPGVDPCCWCGASPDAE